MTATGKQASAYEQMRQITAAMTNGVLIDSFKAATKLPDSNEARMSKAVIQGELERRNPELTTALDRWSLDDSVATQDDVVLRMTAGMDRSAHRKAGA